MFKSEEFFHEDKYDSEVTLQSECIELAGNPNLIYPIEMSDNENVHRPASAATQDDSDSDASPVTVPNNLLEFAAANEYRIIKDNSGCLTVERKSPNSILRAGSHETSLEIEELMNEWLQSIHEVASGKVCMPNWEVSPGDQVKTQDLKLTKGTGSGTSLMEQESASRLIFMSRETWNPSVVNGIQLPMDTVEDNRYLVVKHPEEKCPKECPECYCSFNASMLASRSDKSLITLICPDCALTIYIVPDNA